MFGLDTFGTTLFCLGALGTTVYIIKMFMMLALGIGDDDIMDMDIDVIDFTADVDLGETCPDVNIDINDSESSFNWLSINIVMSFLMLFGWFGLGIYELLLGAELHGVVQLIAQGISILIGGITGVAGVQLNFWCIKQIAKLHHSGTMNRNNLLGQQGTVYIRITPNNTGAIMIKADNNIVMEMAATSYNGKETIKIGTTVKVIGVYKERLVVEPVIE